MGIRNNSPTSTGKRILTPIRWLTERLILTPIRWRMGSRFQTQILTPIHWRWANSSRSLTLIH